MSSHPSSLPSRDLHVLAVIGVIGAVLLIVLPLFGALVLFGAYRRTLQNAPQSAPVISVVPTSTNDLTQPASSTAPQILSIKLGGAQLSDEGVYGIRMGIPLLISVQAVNTETLDIVMVPGDRVDAAESLGAPHKNAGGVYTLSWNPVSPMMDGEMVIYARSGLVTFVHRLKVAVIN